MTIIMTLKTNRLKTGALIAGFPRPVQYYPVILAAFFLNSQNCFIDSCLCLFSYTIHRLD